MAGRLRRDTRAYEGEGDDFVGLLYFSSICGFV